MERSILITKELQSTRRKMVERFAALQIETNRAESSELATKLGEAAASTAKEFEKPKPSSTISKSPAIISGAQPLIPTNLTVSRRGFALSKGAPCRDVN